jgi:hypothetical protein
MVDDINQQSDRQAAQGSSLIDVDLTPARGAGRPPIPLCCVFHGVQLKRILFFAQIWGLFTTKISAKTRNLPTT